MFQPVKELQFCFGLSCVLLSVGGCWSMISGSVVNLSIAGAKLSVNQKLEKVERITQALEQSTQQLKSEPSVSKLKLKAIEQELKTVDRDIQREEKAIADELDHFIDGDI